MNGSWDMNGSCVCICFSFEKDPKFLEVIYVCENKHLRSIHFFRLTKAMPAKTSRLKIFVMFFHSSGLKNPVYYNNSA